MELLWKSNISLIKLLDNSQKFKLCKSSEIWYKSATIIIVMTKIVNQVAHWEII